jgi:O-antigen/teichoic acid export membrane protein
MRPFSRRVQVPRLPAAVAPSSQERLGAEAVRLPNGPAADDDARGDVRTDTSTMQRAHIRGSTLLVLGRVLSVLLTTATHIVIVRALTKDEFGGFAYALALASASQVLLSLGQGRLLSRFMAKYEEERDYARLIGSMVLALVTILVTSTVLVATLFLLPHTLVESAVHDPATVKIVLILAFLAPLDALDQVFIALFAAFSNPRAIFFRKFLLTPVLRFVVVVALIVTGSSVTFLAVGYLASGVVGLIVSVLVFITVLRQRNLMRHLRGPIVLPYRAVFGFSVPLLTLDLFQLSMTFGGVFILGFFHPAAEVASYRAASSPARLNTTVLLAFMPMFLPLAARLFARADLEALRRSYWHTSAFVAVLTFPVFALTGPFAPEFVVTLFGERYANSSDVLALLSIGYYISAMLGFNNLTLQVCERIRFLVGVNLLVTVLNVAICLLLVQRYGAIGVALANMVALVVQNLLNQWALRRALKTAFIDRSCARCYLVIVLAIAALWLFRELVHPSLVTCLLAAAVASLLVLLAGRGAIELGGTFPELLRLPGIRRFVR